MSPIDILTLTVTAVVVISFALVFTVLYLNYANSQVASIKSGSADLDLIDDTIYHNMNGKKRYRRVLRVTKQILFYIAIAILIPFLALSLYTKMSNGIAMIDGRGVIVVASGSMSEKNSANPYLDAIDNQLDTYDLITIESVQSDADLQIYDIIAYRNNEGINVIHRIVGTDIGKDGEVRYITRGDSNNASDSYKPSLDDVLGKYSDKRIPYVGIFFMFLQSYAGILTVLAVIYCLIMIELISGRIYNAQGDRLEILMDAIDFENDTEFDDELDYRFVETITYKNRNYQIEVQEDDE
ncbi:MAG: signal peptidase I [Clostridia bacterium]|nr:signal peptidase I [Clostridia bacterium]